MKKNSLFLYLGILGVLGLTVISGCVGKREHRYRPSKSLEREKARRPKVKFIQASDFEQDVWAVDNYFIEIEDVLEISVWQIEELQKDVVVRPDGMISFPLIGEIPAQGKTIEQLRKDIVEKIKLYIRTPQVSVTISEFGGKRAVVMGEVSSRGIIRFNAPITIMEAIALAGGWSINRANMDKIFVIREVYKDEPTIIMVNVSSILKKGNLRENISIMPGDIIYVPMANIATFKQFMSNVFGPVVGYAQDYYGDTWKRWGAGKWRYSSE